MWQKLRYLPNKYAITDHGRAGVEVLLSQPKIQSVYDTQYHGIS